jgi:hypothetical protein
MYTSNQRLRRPIVSWHRHGLTLLAVPEHSILLDITMFMDVHPQPGPIEVLKRTCSGNVNPTSNNEVRNSNICIDRMKLLSFRNFTAKPTAAILTYLKSEGILKYRDRRGGIRQDRQTINKIAVVNGRRPLVENNRQRNDRSCLIRISCVNNTTAPATNEFAVPKCLFTNICG